MTKRLLVAAALVVSALWAQQGNVIYPVAQQNLDAYQRDQWNKGSGTRTDLKPSDLLKEDGSKVDIKTGTCIGSGAAGTGASICRDEDGTVSFSISVAGAKATVYGNAETGNAGGCIGVGGPLVPGVSGSAQVCGDRDNGLTGKVSGGLGMGQATATFDSQH